jgi:hypothetical protein
MNIESILQNIEENILNINRKLEKIYKKLDIEEDDLNIQELKKKKINIDDAIIKKSLENNSLSSDFEIIKNLYFNDSKELFPIKFIEKKIYKYWLNNKWNTDIDGTYIKDVIINNLNSCYLRYNNYDRYKNNTDTYIKNQEYISMISSDEKYKTRLLNHIKHYITSM